MPLTQHKNLNAVRSILEDTHTQHQKLLSSATAYDSSIAWTAGENDENSLANDPWQDMLKGDE